MRSDLHSLISRAALQSHRAGLHFGRATRARSNVPTVTPALFAFLHHAAAFVLFASLFAELMLLRQTLTVPIAQSLIRLDAIYGISAMTIIIVGLVRVYFTEKGATYYLHSGTFIAKVVLFVIIGLISIKPTRAFIAWRRTLKAGGTLTFDESERLALRRVVHMELGLLMILILCAALMARGVGYIG